MPENGMSVALLDEDDIREIIQGKQHWLFCFGSDAYWAIDAIDEAIGKYPTYPTIMYNGLTPSMTIVPKAELTAEKVAAILESLGAVASGPVTLNKDVLTITNSLDQALWIYQSLEPFSHA